MDVIAGRAIQQLVYDGLHYYNGPLPFGSPLRENGPFSPRMRKLRDRYNRIRKRWPGAVRPTVNI